MWLEVTLILQGQARNGLAFEPVSWLHLHTHMHMHAQAHNPRSKRLGCGHQCWSHSPTFLTRTPWLLGHSPALDVSEGHHNADHTVWQ